MRARSSSVTTASAGSPPSRWGSWIEPGATWDARAETESTNTWSRPVGTPASRSNAGGKPCAGSGSGSRVCFAVPRVLRGRFFGSLLLLLLPPPRAPRRSVRRRRRRFSPTTSRQPPQPRAPSIPPLRPRARDDLRVPPCDAAMGRPRRVCDVPPPGPAGAARGSASPLVYPLVLVLVLVHVVAIFLDVFPDVAASRESGAAGRRTRGRRARRRRSRVDSGEGTARTWA